MHILKNIEYHKSNSSYNDIWPVYDFAPLYSPIIITASSFTHSKSVPNRKFLDKYRSIRCYGKHFADVICHAHDICEKVELRVRLLSEHKGFIGSSSYLNNHQYKTYDAYDEILKYEEYIRMRDEEKVDHWQRLV